MSPTPDEVISAVAPYGVKISPRTLANYARQQLVTPPQVRSLGRGLGRHSEYPPAAVAETVAAYKLMEDRTGEIITRYEALYGAFFIGGPWVFELPLGGRVRAVEVATARHRAYNMTVRQMLAILPGVRTDPPLTDEEQATRLRWTRILITWLTFYQCVKEGKPIPDRAIVTDGGRPVPILDIRQDDPSATLVEAAAFYTPEKPLRPLK